MFIGVCVCVCVCMKICVYVYYVLIMNICMRVYMYLCIYVRAYTGCPRRNVKHIGRVFLMLNYTDISQNTYIQS